MREQRGLFAPSEAAAHSGRSACGIAPRFVELQAGETPQRRQSRHARIRHCICLVDAQVLQQGLGFRVRAPAESGLADVTPGLVAEAGSSPTWALPGHLQ